MLPPRSMPNSARRAHADQVWDDRSRLWTGCPGRSSLMRFDVAAHGGRSEKSAAQTRYPGEFGMTGPDFGIRGQDNCCNGERLSAVGSLTPADKKPSGFDRGKGSGNGASRGGFIDLDMQLGLCSRVLGGSTS